MNKTQQKARQRQGRLARKRGRTQRKGKAAIAPPVVGMVAQDPALHQATKPLAPELEAAIRLALQAGPALVFVIQHDVKAKANHCYRFNSEGWPQGDNGDAKGLVLGEFAKMRGSPAVRPAQTDSTSGW